MVSGVGTEEHTSFEPLDTTIVHEQPSNIISETFQMLRSQCYIMSPNPPDTTFRRVPPAGKRRTGFCNQVKMCTTVRIMTKCSTCWYVINTTHGVTQQCEGYIENGVCSGVHHPTKTEYAGESSCPECVKKRTGR